MNIVKCKHQDTCAIASLAMLTGKSYEQCIRIYKPKYRKGDRPGRITWPRFMEVVINAGYNFCGPLNIRKLKVPAMLITYTPPKRGWTGFWHASVWDPDKKKVLDPSNRRRARPIKWFQKHLSMVAIHYKYIDDNC